MKPDVSILPVSPSKGPPMAAAARLAIPLFAADRPNGDAKFTDSLETFALDQLNWVLGLNPYDASMLQGTGHAWRRQDIWRR